MSIPARSSALIAIYFVLACSGRLSANEPLPAALQGVNPDMLSGGLFSALDAEGAFGARPSPPRARAGGSDPAKGRPLAVLDARIGANIRLGDDPSALPPTQRGQAEPHLVRSVSNPNVLLATFQEGRFADSGAIGCGYAVSRDSGLTWTRALIPTLTTASGGRFNRATDPVAGAGPQGDLYLQNLASVQGAFALAAVVVSRSTDGGLTWSAPATVYESASGQISPDKNWLAVNDYPGTPNSGRLVSTWTSFFRTANGTTISNPLVASVSDDRGSTWSAPIEITAQSSRNQGSQPVFLPDGSLAVIYITFLDPTDVTRFSIHCKRSLDGGRTFPGSASVVVDSVVGWDDPDLRDGVFLPSAAVARETGELFVTYAAVLNGSPRVMVTKSVDRGATWSVPVVASDQPVGTSVMNPAVAATPDGRTVSVAFMDKRNASDGRSFVDHYVAHSFDGGVTWQPNLRLSELSSDIRYGPMTSRGVMLGDYIGIAPSLASGQPCVAIWCDTRAGDSDPFVAAFLSSQDSSYGAFVTVRRLSVSSSDYLEDTDGDGVSNYLEFLGGSDPRRAEVGHDISIRYVTPTTVEAVWAERSGVQKMPAIDGVSVAPYDQFSQGGFSLAATIAANVPADQLPDTPLRPGLVWRGARVSTFGGPAQAVTRSLRFSAGLPVRAATNFASIGTDVRLVNLSTRGHAGVGDNQMIVGFVLDGNKSMLIRAAGPALASLGISGALADPRLTLAAPASDLLRTNDNWAEGGAEAALFARLGAFPFSTGSLDAALALSLGIQSYTAIVSGANNATGIALVEAYDADPLPGAPAKPRLLNLSTRGEVRAGDSTLIAGFVLSGTQSRRVLIRAIGPSLAAFGVKGALADPVLTLFQGNTPLAANDDWEINRASEVIAVTSRRVGAFPLVAASLDSALLLTLAPGAYTAVISSADGSSGLALVEVYDAD